MADGISIAPRTRISLTGAEVPDEVDARVSETPASSASTELLPATAALGVASEKAASEKGRTGFTTGEKVAIGLGYAAYGFAGGYASVKWLGADGGGSKSPSASAFKENIRHWTNDGDLNGHNVMHASLVGGLTYWSARKIGLNPLESLIVTGVTATTFEAGQAVFPGHAPDKGDVKNSLKFALAGEGVYQLGNYAQTKNGPLWKALGHLGKTQVGGGTLSFMPKRGGGEIKYERQFN